MCVRYACSVYICVVHDNVCVYAYLFGEGDALRGKVDLQSEDGTTPGTLTHYVEDPSRHHLLSCLHLEGGVVANLKFLKRQYCPSIRLLSLHLL